jgi:neutral ceramidase
MRATGLALLPLFVLACGGDDDDVPPTTEVTTELCNYVPLVPTANSGSTVAAAPLSAGAAERILHIPVGTALGGYTGRAGFISSAGSVDARRVELPGTFNPSIGVTTAPRVKALALKTGNETVIVIKADIIFVYEGMVYDLETRLGPEFAGKVLIAVSHSHSGWAQFTGHGPLKLGAGQLRDLVYKRFLDDFEGAARDAIAALEPAKLGVFADPQFDQDDTINRDRRGENNDLPGGTNKGDEHLFLIRVDRTDGSPIAIVPVFGEHGTLNDQDNPFASADASGAIEHALEEQFDSKVVVLHLQGAGADVSPAGHGGLDCNGRPGKESDPCFAWTSEEGHGRGAIPTLMAAYAAAGGAMRDSLELEMITRSIETGPFPQTFSIREGALTYPSFQADRMPDGIVWENGVLSPVIDEFNAQVGAGLCETELPMFPAAQIPGTEGVLPYGSCLKLDLAAEILEPIFDIDFGVDATHPVCESTRTTISALRIGEFVIGTLPGEVSVMLADLVREKSPAGPDKTIVVGYSQGHVGYMLRPEDWVLGGYEPSVTFWGPLEAEYIAEKLLGLMPLAISPIREDATIDGANRLAVPTMTDGLEIDDPAPGAGTIPSTVPDVTWARTGTPVQAQPATSIARVSGIATFTWIGDDPQVKTPRVTLQRETAPNSGTFVDVTRRSGRVVEDAEIVLAYTPSPLQRSGPQTHVWVAEWQAVPWWGEVGLDTLDDRGGVPLGRYRFHVAGKGWSLDSNAWTVTSGGVTLGAPSRANGNITAKAQWHAPKGWRLLDMNLHSNQPIPIRNQQVTVELLAAAQVLSTATVTTDANGNAQVGNNAAATDIRITDRFGNSASAAIP